MILRGVFVFYIWGGGGGGGGGVCRKRRPWSISLLIEDLVVSDTSKVEIPVSSYL